MESERENRELVSVHVQNVGGIVRTEVELTPGVNVLTGRNATNRTSFLRSIMGAMGSDEVSIRGDADEGFVELKIGDDTYTRRLRRDDGIVASGDPYLEDPTVADVFAFLLESNDARQAVARGEDLRDVIMRPIDTDELEADIDRLETEKREIDTTLERRDDLLERSERLRQERDQIQDRIDLTREDLADVKAAIDSEDIDIEETRAEKTALDQKLTSLQKRRSEREEVDFRLQTERETLDQLRDELSTIEEYLGGEPNEPNEEPERITDRITRLRERKRDLEAAINQLQGIIRFNREMLSTGDGTSVEVLASDDHASGNPSVGLLPAAESLVCWTCGNETQREEIEETVDKLQSRHSELVANRRSTVSELEETIEHRDAIRERREKREKRESERRRLVEEIEGTEAAIDRLQVRREELDEEIDRRESEVEELREEDITSIVELHADANELEFEVDRLESERDRIEDRIDETEAELDRLDTLRERRDEVSSELEAARTRIQRLEASVVESFNRHMDELLSVLEYQNVDRIWLERADTGNAGDRHTSQARFDLHVVRTTDTGAAYEDVVDHLSESEREVTGLVFALSGYLAHDVHETVPFMLLDSLEAIDSRRIGSLIEYFSEFAPYLVVALLPEDAASVDDRYPRIESI